LWAVFLARSEAGSATERLDSVSKLEADVARRVKAGEIAHADLLLVRQESAIARVALVEAQARVIRSTRRYQLLTGSDQLPDNPQETVSGNAPNGLHPRLAAGQAIAERARARMKLAGESQRDAPSIGVQYRRDRDTFGASVRDSVGFAITIPFAADVRNAPLTASANTALIQADAQYQRLLAEIEAERVEAEAQLESMRAGVEQSVLREQAAVERLTLIRRAFTLGETSLAELLRAESQATEARIERGRSRIRLSAAHANLNQVRGIMP
jgi:outer membrane protein TolC